MDTKNFKWMNESAVENDGNKIVITAPPKPDFFKGNISECEDGFCRSIMQHTVLLYRNSRRFYDAGKCIS